MLLIQDDIGRSFELQLVHMHSDLHHAPLLLAQLQLPRLLAGLHHLPAAYAEGFAIAAHSQ